MDSVLNRSPHNPVLRGSDRDSTEIYSSLEVSVVHPNNTTGPTVGTVHMLGMFRTVHVNAVKASCKRNQTHMALFIVDRW